MEDSRDKKHVRHDDFGQIYGVDYNDERDIPYQSEPVRDGDEFTTFDSSDGHCGLCGRLTCGGECF